jgi:hypothetical protein
MALFCFLVLMMSALEARAIADCGGIDRPGDDRCPSGEGDTTVQWGTVVRGYSLGIVIDKALPSPRFVGSPRVVTMWLCVKNDSQSTVVIYRDRFPDFNITDTQAGNPPVVRIGPSMTCYNVPPPHAPPQQISISPGHVRMYPIQFATQPGHRYVFKADGMLRPIGQEPVDLESGYLPVTP